MRDQRKQTGYFTIDKALRHITRIEKETSLKVSGIVNNTHLIHETTAEDILKGYELARTYPGHQVFCKVQLLCGTVSEGVDR